MKLVLQFGGHDSDDAGVPLIAGEHDGTAVHVAFVGDGLESLFGDAAFDLFALFVYAVEFAGEVERFVGIVGEEELQGAGAGAETSAGVDARGNLERDVLGADGFWVEF